MSKNIKGKCLCGSIQFTVKEPFHHFYFCHCSQCQKSTGSAHAANLFGPVDAVTCKNIQLSVRRLSGTKNVDMSTEIFNVRWLTPIGLAPAGSQKAFHRLGEIAVARAARSCSHLQILSTVSNTSIEAVNQARGEPVWYQLYTQPHSLFN